MKLLAALLALAAVVDVNLAYIERSDTDMVEDDSPRIGYCGERLANFLILMCKPFGGIALRKRNGVSDNPLAASVWHRNTRELYCNEPTQSAVCFCCSAYHGPCTLNTLIANYCEQPPPEYDRYFIKG